MATATVTAPMKRKAEALAELIPTFSHGRDKHTGIEYVTVPSSDDPLHTGHNTNGIGCLCEGFRRRGVCSHQLAVATFYQRAEAASIAAHQPAPAKSAQQIYAEAGAFGPCCHKGCGAAATGKNRRCDEHFQTLLDSLGY